MDPPQMSLPNELEECGEGSLGISAQTSVSVARQKIMWKEKMDRMGVMHPSLSLSLDVALQGGVAGGPDLYTFVTSAAGHMMRTLQKPRKNRPTKRQVNHRRFLHNMIQRKFADIEAGNHRLASALYFNVDQKKPDSPEPAPDALEKEQDLTDSLNSPMEKKRPQPTSKPKSRKRKLSTADQNMFEMFPTDPASTQTAQFYGYDNKSDWLSTDEQIGLMESNLPLEQSIDISPCFSPELSPLPLDSFDFSVQMFTDASSSSQNNSEMVESQWTDMIDVFGRDLTDTDANLDGLCEAEGCDFEQEDFFNKMWQSRFSSTNSFITSCYENTVETDNVPVSLELQNAQVFPTSCQSYQDPPYLGACSNPIPFEGVAQSFPVSQNAPRFSIPTPPYEGDWLFTDILTENMAFCNRHT